MEMEPHRMEIHSAQKNQNEIPRLVLNNWLGNNKNILQQVFSLIICMLKSLYQIVWETFVNLPDFFILQDSIIKKLLLAFHVAIAFAFTLTLLLLVTQY